MRGRIRIGDVSIEGPVELLGEGASAPSPTGDAVRWAGEAGGALYAHLGTCSLYVEVSGRPEGGWVWWVRRGPQQSAPSATGYAEGAVLPWEHVDPFERAKANAETMARALLTL